MASNHTIILYSILFITLGIISIWVQFFFEMFFILGLFMVTALPTVSAKQYIKDWLPLIVVLLLYESMRGVVDELISRVHVTDIIAAERFLFGGIPTIWLQHAWHPTEKFAWYDIVLYLFYLSHYIFPFFVAFALWLREKVLFQAYIKGLVSMTFLSLATYYFFPAAPPWLASIEGHLPPIDRLLAIIPEHFGFQKHVISFTFNLIGSNPVAAMPSLHAAWPTFIVGFLIMHYQKSATVLLIIPLGVMIAIVYFGEHYIVDIIAGVFCAALGLIISKIHIKKVSQK